MSAVAVLETLAAQRFVRFLAAGALNTLFGYAMFVLMLRLGAGLAVALVGSTTAGVLFNFQTSRRLVFRSRRSGLLWRFVGVYASMLAVNYLALRTLAPLGLPNWEAQAVMVLPMALLAFAAQRHFVFRTEPVAT